MTEEHRQLKYYYDKKLAINLADKILKVCPKFQKQKFVNTIEKKIENFIQISKY